MTRLTVLYFASLREAAGCTSEEFFGSISSLADLYSQLSTRHGFGFPMNRLRVAMDGAFVAWESVPGEGAEIAFIPPVSGG